MKKRKLSIITPYNIHLFIDKLNQASTSELVELIESKNRDEQILIFTSISEEKSIAIFPYLSIKVQKRLLNALPSKRVANLLNSISPDDRTALLEQLKPHLVVQLLTYLTPEEKALSIKLLGYPEDSVGRLMTPDYIAIKMDWTVKQVLDYVREKGHDSETINVIYAVDNQGKLIDDFRIRQFLLASLDTKVETLSDHKYVALNVNDDEETAINIFRQYERTALPVIDQKGILIGIVTIDDVLQRAVEKDTKEVQMIGGSRALKEPYMKMPFFQLIQKRVSWLIILFLGEMLTANAMGFFEDEIAKAVVLALFLPLIISSGGNAGSQASTLIIRALALREISLKEWWKIMQREIGAGFFLGCILGTVGFLRISIWSFFSSIYGPHWLLIALTVFLALIGVVLWGTFAGAMLPLLLRRCGFDPAMSSAPFVATIVDVTGLIIYFTIALGVLHGTLL